MAKYSEQDVLNALSNLVAEFHVLHGKPHVYAEIGKIQHLGVPPKDMQEKLDFAIDVLMSKKALQNPKDYTKKRVNRARVVTAKNSTKMQPASTSAPKTKGKNKTKTVAKKTVKAGGSRAEKRKNFLEAVKDHYGKIDTITRKQIVEVTNSTGLPWPNWIQAKSNTIDRGVYGVPKK